MSTEARPLPTAVPVTTAMLALLPALVAFQAISTDLYLPALPGIVGDLATTVERVQLTLSLFLVAFGTAQLAYGPISDRLGRRRPLLFGTGLYVLASLACMLAPTIEWLVACRVLQAIGACSGMVLGRAVVRDLYEPADAARILAYLGTAMAMAPILGPILGGWLTSAFGWRANFALLTLFGVVTFLGVLLVLPETNRRPDPGATRPSTLLTNYSSLLTDRLYLGRVAITAFTYSGIFTFISGSAYVLIEVVGLTPDRYGLCFAGGVLGWVLGTMIAGRFGKRLGLPRLLAIGTAISATAGLGGLGWALLASPSWPMVVLPMAAFMTGAGFTLPAAMALAIGPHPTRAGLASALMGFLQLSTASAIGYALSLAYAGTALPMMLCLALVTATAFLATRMVPGAGGESKASEG